MNKGEAIKILKDFHDESALFSVRTALETLYPEFKESEDEKIRKRISQALHGDVLDMEETNKALAWLEKQGDSPIKWNKNTKDCKPKVSHSVLMKTTHGIAEGEWQGEHWHQYRWAGLVRDTDVLSWIELSDLEKQGEQKPTIEMKSAEESLGIDSETYNKIVDECIYGEQKSQRMISAEAKEAMYGKPSDKIEQKSSWTKEDDAMLDTIEGWLDTLCEYLKDSRCEYIPNVKYCIDRLKSLKQRYTWKPSDEQIGVIESLINNRPCKRKHLDSLYNDLKKLREDKL